MPRSYTTIILQLSSNRADLDSIAGSARISGETTWIPYNKKQAAFKATLHALREESRNADIHTSSEQQGESKFSSFDRLNDFRFLTPEAPLPKEAKQFKLFLKALAKSLGCSENALYEKGYRCTLVSKDKANIKIPNAAHFSMFKSLLSGVPLSKIVPENTLKKIYL